MSSTRLTRCTDLQENDADDDTPLEVPVGEKDTRKNFLVVNMSHKNQTCTGRALLLNNICLGLCTIYTWQYISGWDMFFFVQVDGAMCTCFWHLFFSRRFLQRLLRRHAIVVIMIANLVVDIKQHIIKRWCRSLVHAQAQTIIPYGFFFVVTPDALVCCWYRLGVLQVDDAQNGKMRMYCANLVFVPMSRSIQDVQMGDAVREVGDPSFIFKVAVVMLPWTSVSQSMCTVSWNSMWSGWPWSSIFISRSSPLAQGVRVEGHWNSNHDQVKTFFNFEFESNGKFKS